MSKKIRQPDQIVDGKKYYIGIPDTLAPSTLKNKNPLYTKIIEDGVNSKTAQKVHNISAKFGRGIPGIGEF